MHRGKVDSGVSELPWGNELSQDHVNRPLVYLWYLGNNEPYELIAERFDIGTSTTFCITRRLSVALVENYNETYIKWPKEEKLEEVMNQFEAKKGFPGVIDAIDGCHIPIKAPRENANEYINRKRFHSVNLQAVTDPDLLITDAFCGYPGRVHDPRVFRNSPLYQAVIANEEEFFPGNCHILGDSAYPLLSWILTPF